MARIKQVTLLQPSSSRKEATFDNQTSRSTFPIPYKAKLKSLKSLKKPILFPHKEFRNKSRKQAHAQKKKTTCVIKASTSIHSWQILLHLQVFLLSRCAELSIPLARSPWEVAEVPRQLREVVCIPDSCTTQIFKQCLKQEKKSCCFLMIP